MKLTARDKQLLLWLPALGTAILYVFFISARTTAQIKVLAKQAAAAMEKTPSPAQITDSESKLNKLQRNLLATQNEQAAAKKRLNTLLQGAADSTSHAKAAEQFAALLPRHGLALLEETPLPTAPAALPPSLQRLAAESRAVLGENSASFWQVRFTGRYLDVVAALEELTASGLPAIPASLSMTEGQQPETKIWTLILWI